MATRETGGEPATKDVQDVAATAKEDVRNATDRIMDRGRDEARTILEQQQRRAADGLTGVADALHAAADKMEGSEIGFVARYAETAADQVETWARRVQQRDIDDVLSEAENYARRNPEIFVGGAFFAGFLVARVAKASSDRRRVRERVYRQEMAGGGPTGGIPATPRGYGYGGGGYPGGLAGDAGPRGSTTTPGASDLTGDAALSATTGPNTPARTSGTPATGGAGTGASGGGDLRPGGGLNPHSGDAPEQRGATVPSGAGIGTGARQTGPGTGPATPVPTPNPGSATATETAATGSPFAAAGNRTVPPAPGATGPKREATPARPDETGGPGGKGERK